LFAIDEDRGLLHGRTVSVICLVLYQSFAVDEDRGLLHGSYCISRLPLMKTTVCCVARTVSVVCR